MGMSKLPNAELAIMQLLWRKPHLSARQIQEELYPNSPRSQHGAVQSLLQRLMEKGFVVRDRDVGVYRFSPVPSREEYASDQLEVLAQRITDGSVVPIITQLLEADRLPKEEIERLRRILEEWE
ncbi:MAG: BlaI/MecI/CopY family transcriptional regulator [Gemmatimonadetes bacterium]|nr:BlaI/MecI/CopY family transcriptional regulator [Gemmatimonadota bacterium]